MPAKGRAEAEAVARARGPENSAVERAGASALASHAPALAAAAVGVAWLLVHAGPAILDPTRIGWTYRGDWVAAQLGWSFFRSAPWSFPLGANPLYPYGVGSTVGFADGIPLVSVLLKLLSPLLPLDFQYLGPWLALCFAAQGFAGAKLVALATRSRAAQALGGALFAVAPPLLHRLADARTGHASLCAQALVLAALWLALAPTDPTRVRGRVVAAIGLVAIATGVHPYFAAMCAALALALVVRLAAVERLLGAGAALAAAAGVLGAAAAGLALFGYLGTGVSLAAEGFGACAADLLTFVNPMGWSRVAGAFPSSEYEYEGFGYLGAAIVALGLAGASLALRRRTSLRSGVKRASPAIAAAVLLALFALSGTVSLAGRPLFHVPLYDAVPTIRDAFRSSGRFVWPLHYVLLLAAIAAIAAGLADRPRLVAGLLAAALALQVIEIRPPAPLEVGDGRWKPTYSPAWALARGRYRHLSLLPPFLVAGGRPAAPEPDACGEPPWPFEAWIPVADLAYRLGLTFDGGYLARLDETRARDACAATRREIRARRIDPDTIWLLVPELVPVFRGVGATCGVLNGLAVCVARDPGDPFAAALAASPLR